MANFELFGIPRAGPKEWEKQKAGSDYKLFVKQCHPTVRLFHFL